ncbi:MAG TPA: FecR domain-containing protein, partial [Xanthomonadales bacterium]|nr:FecR domain-containing protein [Xanthomonadales bacterium]
MGVYGTMTGRSHEHESLLERAAAWHARLRADDAAAPDHAGFAAWLAADPRHRLAYADVCAAAYALESAGVAPPAVSRREARPRRGAWSSALAGSAFALLAAFGLWHGAAPWQNVTSDAFTVSGEQRRVTLPDGSRMLLDGDSAVDIAFAGATRTIVLKRGAAFFEVEPDAARPFVVRAGDASATALGTRYAVERLDGGVVVAVEEGIVEVRSDTAPGTARRLAAGDSVSLPLGGAPGEVVRDDAALAWTDARLVFSATPLPHALARIDRHVAGRIVRMGDAAADARVTAAIPAADAEGGLAAIAREQGLTLRRL